MKSIGPTKSIANPVLSGCVLFVLFVYYLIDNITVGTLKEKTMQKQVKQYYHLAECQALVNHDRGHWEHKHTNELLNNNNDTSFMNRTYLVATNIHQLGDAKVKLV